MAVMFQVSSTGSAPWTDIPNPSEWTCSYQDLSTEGTAGRSLDGTMHKDLVAVKRKNALTWWGKDDSVVNAITTAAKGQVFIYLKYNDPFDGGSSRTVVCYTGDIVCTCQMAMGHYVWQVSLSFIEQ